MIIAGRILDKGKVIISNAITGLATSYATGFRIGDLAAFDIITSETGPRGTVVFEGSTQDIAVTRIAIDTVRFVCSITEGVGPFTMGNLVLYMQDDKGDSVPFIMVAFPKQVVKTPSNDQVTTDGYTLPGSRFAVAIHVKHSDEATDVVVEILPPDYSSLPSFATENDVPPGNALTYKQYVVNYDTRVKTPVMFAVDEDNTRWGNPFYQQLRDPRFGQLDGGVDGEGYGGEAAEIVFGMFYTTEDRDFTVNPVGGSTYTDSSILQTVGGATYGQTVNKNPYE